MAAATTTQQGLGLDNPQMPNPTAVELGESSKDIDFALNYSDIPDWDELRGAPHFKIGIVVGSCRTKDRHISAISKPASCCTLTSLVILENLDKDGECEAIRKWLRSNRLQEGTDDISIGWGQSGFRDLLSSEVDAVYVIVPPGSQRDYVLAALEARKHVLLNDPVSTSLPEFTEQQVYAKRHGKFIQFTTMFLHQYKVRSFLEGVLYDEDFGRIHTINSFVRLCFDDVEKVGVKFPLGSNDGSIRVLGRFCVLMSTLFFSRVGSFARSAQVKYIQEGHDGEILSAECVVKYSEGRELSFDVGYTHSATRQSIEVHSDARYAAMKDFIIEHPDGLATYRLYEKAPTASERGNVDIKSGESIDMAGGPSQQMMMWRKFVELSQSLDRKGGWDRSDETAECRELANVALQTKRILSALVKSGQNSEEVVIDDIEYE